MRSHYLYYLLLSTLILISCSTANNKQNTYRADASHFCEIHDITYWETSGKLEELNSLNSSERQTTLLKAIHNAVSTPEMKKVIFLDGDDNRPLSEYYIYLQQAIPKLTGEPFVCPAVKEFYNPVNNPRSISDQ
jgi:hypothetical protein